ncbi:integrase [Leptothrix sp. C29]|uniref:Integrase n=1 Tax=Sphaerotilus uruguayifluvii TaxID=2735897 RepID=A0ABX2G0R9_9BURK|nr:integrase [Leptothrix sp. C29]
MAKVSFTAGRVSGFKCPAGKTQAFLWDANTPGLGLRATPAGRPAYVFQSVFQGKTIRDKVEGERVIPLTPHVWRLLAALPRRGAFVFAGERGDIMARPHRFHDAACSVAGLEGLTLHGLRRSFKSLSEWQDIPAGVVAQLMGHKPSATAERHYTVRPLDLLRVHHERLEAWILEQAGLPVPSASEEPARLRAV